MNKNLVAIAPLETTGATGLVGDLKTFHIWKCYGVGVATELIASNSQGVQAMFAVPFEFIASQLESITSDLDIHGVKLGAIRSVDSVRLISSLIDAYSFRTLLYDPAIKTKDGGHRVPLDVVPALKEHILPRVTVLVVNAAEAALLLGQPVGSDVAAMKEAARELATFGPKTVVVTGGHLPTRVTDVIWDGLKALTADGPRNPAANTLGIGDVFSAAVLAQVVKGTATQPAVLAAKQYVAKAMQHPFKIGRGTGPLNLNIPV